MLVRARANRLEPPDPGWTCLRVGGRACTSFVNVLLRDSELSTSAVDLPGALASAAQPLIGKTYSLLSGPTATVRSHRRTWKKKKKNGHRTRACY